MTDAKREIDDLIAKFASLPSAEDRRAFLLGHPVMISFSVVPTIVARDDMAVAFAQTIDVVGGRLMPVDGGVSINFNADRYPVGQGPIEILLRRQSGRRLGVTKQHKQRHGGTPFVLFTEANLTRAKRQIRWRGFLSSFI